MPTSSFSNSVASMTGQAPGYIQSDGFFSPIVLGSPTGTTSPHSKGPAQFPFGLMMTAGSFQSLSSSIGLTAHASGGQANALLLTSQFNTVTTVGTAADSVKLPATSAGSATVASTIGEFVIIQNATATSMQVYGSGTDTINAVATGTGVAIAGNKFGIFLCTGAGTWVAMLALA